MTGDYILDEKIALDKKSYLLTNDSEIISKLNNISSKNYLIAPDATKIVRNLTKYGMVGTAMRMALSLGVLNILKLSFLALKKPMGLLKKKFSIVLPLLITMDYLNAKKIKPKLVFLHYQITDLALANNNKELIVTFLKKCPITPGLMTNNLLLLHQKLEEWGLTVHHILLPAYANGYSMRPSKEECEHIITKTKRSYYSFSSLSPERIKDETTYLRALPFKESFIYQKTE